MFLSPISDWNRSNYGRLLRYLEDTEITALAIDTETSGVEFNDQAFCVSMAWRDGHGRLCSTYTELERDYDGAGRAAATAICKRAERWVFHNSKFDLQKLILGGVIDRDSVEPDRFEDTEGLYYIHDMLGRKALKYLAKTLLKLDTAEEETLTKVRKKLKKKKKDGYTVLPRSAIIPYAIKDAEYTLLLYEYLLLLYEKERDEVDWAVYAREKRITCTLLDMEARGIGVNYKGLQELFKEYNTEYRKLEMFLTSAMEVSDWAPIGKTGKVLRYNCNSNNQIIEFAKEVHGIKLPNAQADTFREHEEHPFFHKLLKYKHYQKMTNTYLRALVKEGRDGVYHPWFNQYKASTGRFTSSSASNE